MGISALSTSRFDRSRNLITVDDRGVVARSWSVGERKRSPTTRDRPFSCPFSAPAILYRPLAPRTGRGLMEIYDSHLIGFNVPRISSSRNASSDFFRTVCSFRALTTSAIKTYARGVRGAMAPISMRPTCLVWRSPFSVSRRRRSNQF